MTYIVQFFLQTPASRKATVADDSWYHVAFPKLD